MSSFDYFGWTPMEDPEHPGEQRVTFIELLEQLRADVDRLTDVSGSVGELDSKLTEISGLIDRLKKLSVTVDGALITVSDGKTTANTYNNVRINRLFNDATEALNNKAAELREYVVETVNTKAGELSAQIASNSGEIASERQRLTTLETGLDTRIDERATTIVDTVRTNVEGVDQRLITLETSVVTKADITPQYKANGYDDSTDLQAAIRGSESLRLHLPAGAYTVNRTIYIPDNFVLTGDGVIEANVSGFAVETGNRCSISGITIRSTGGGLKTDGECRLSGLSLAGGDGVGLSVNGAVTVFDSRISGSRAVFVGQGQTCHIVNSVLTANVDAGDTYCLYNVGNLVVNSCQLRNFNSAAFNLGSLTIIGSDIHGGRNVNTEPLFNSSAANRLTVENCRIIVSNSNTLIHCDQNFTYTITNNHIQGTTTAAFRVIDHNAGSLGRLILTGNTINVTTGKLSEHPLGVHMVTDTNDNLTHSGIIRSGGWIEVEKCLVTGHGDEFPTLASGIPVGAVFWHFNHKRPFWWSGDAWMSADGKTLSELGLE